MVSVSIAWLGYQFWRLLWQQDPIWPTSPRGAVDLNLRYKELHNWFAGEPVPRVYPPAATKNYITGSLESLFHESTRQLVT